jgi:hypothetical protein
MNKVRELLCFNYDNYQLLIALSHLQLSPLNVEWKYKTHKTKYLCFEGSLLFILFRSYYYWKLVLSRNQRAFWNARPTSVQAFLKIRLGL